MKIVYLIFFLFCSFSILSVYSLQKDISEEQTEATALLSKDKLDFCCERDKTDESAHEMSEQEAQQITMNILTPDSSPTPNSRPRNRNKGSGQR